MSIGAGIEGELRLAAELCDEYDSLSLSRSVTVLRRFGRSGSDSDSFEEDTQRAWESMGTKWSRRRSNQVQVVGLEDQDEIQTAVVDGVGRATAF